MRAALTASDNSCVYGKRVLTTCKQRGESPRELYSKLFMLWGGEGMEARYQSELSRVNNMLRDCFEIYKHISGGDVCGVF